MPNDTPPVPRRLRFEVLRRDNHTCRYCGASAPDVELVVDHVVPRALGGTNDPSNLVTACRECNSGKASTSPDEHFVAAVEDHDQRWREAMRRAADEWLANATAADDRIEKFNAAWSGWTVTRTGEQIPREGDWAQSVTNWLNAGLSIDHIIRMIRPAMERPDITSTRWRYFCWTVCRAIDDIREAAQAEMNRGSE